MSTSTDKAGSGLTVEEAKEFHKLFVQGFIGFTIVAIVAHFLAWNWRPWGGSVTTTSMLDHLHHVTSLLA
jgi:light-harvesting complex 1 beta chain